MGGHKDGHAPHDPYKVPSPDQYRLEDAPEMMKYQEKITKMGLKDPWIRNYIWRYDKRYGTKRSRLAWMMSKGLGTGLVAFGITIAIENALGIDYHPWHHAHNDDSNGHETKQH